MRLGTTESSLPSSSLPRSGGAWHNLLERGGGCDKLSSHGTSCTGLLLDIDDNDKDYDNDDYDDNCHHDHNDNYNDD